MECTMEIVETPEHESPKTVEPCSEVQASSHVESPVVEASSQSEESHPEKEPSTEAEPDSEVPPSQNVSSSKTVPSSETSSSLAGSSKEVSSTPAPALPNVMNEPASKKQRLDYNSMSTGVYLDSTVVPILHVALVNLDRLRPADPVQFVIDFLLHHKAQYSKSKEQPSCTSSNQA